jgi:molybdopterin molybdotransferase
LLVPLERVLGDLRARTRPVDPRTLPIERTAGLVLAEPLRSHAGVPAEAIALRDGWAIAAGDVVGASSYSPVPVGAPPAWVEVGQPMPAGTDAVLPPDAVAGQGTAVEIVAEVAPGEGVRRAGEDAAPGVILREAGERMRSTDVAVALALGIRQVPVRQARARILSLPIVTPDGTAELVGRLAQAAGAVVEHAAPVSNEFEANALKGQGSDMVIVVGGTGLGGGDQGARVFATSGSLVAHGIALRPGETSGCGVIGAAPVILVPGRVEAALAATLMLVLPSLDHLMSATPRRPSVSGRLTRKVSSGIGMTDLVLLRRTGQELEPLAVADLTLAAIAGADAWLAVPPENEGFAAGETVPAFLL